MLEIDAIGGRLLAPLFEPGFNVADELLLAIQRDLADQHAGAQENEIRVEHVTPAIVVDLGDFPVVIKVNPLSLLGL